MRPTVRRCLRCAPTLRTPSALTRLHDSPLSRYVTISEEVKDALHRSLPVVSLETAITSHGLPYEQAVSTAKSLDEIIRVSGAVPAVVGLIDGKIKIGLDGSEIARLADPESKVKKWKVGKRDIAPAIVHKVDGGTTVSATSFLSHLAGIDVFVTGGIGGVHRGAQETMDISSDLTELGKTPTTVVCAGAKSILDIGLTLEYLETLGVTVTTFGRAMDFPAFYASKSGFQAPSNVATAREAAELIYLSKLLKTKTGTLIGVPIPEQYEGKSKRIQSAVEQAVQESERNGIAKKGKEVTPWILARVKELSGGESVESNIALIENNARVGTGIAVELSRLIRNRGEIV